VYYRERWSIIRIRPVFGGASESPTETAITSNLSEKVNPSQATGGLAGGLAVEAAVVVQHPSLARTAAHVTEVAHLQSQAISQKKIETLTSHATAGLPVYSAFEVIPYNTPIFSSI